jgi:hypothetical protein
MASEKQRLDEAKLLKKRLEDEDEAKRSPPAQGKDSDLHAALQVRQPLCSVVQNFLCNSIWQLMIPLFRC